MKKVTNEQVEAALKLLMTWAKQNNVNYFTTTYLQEFKKVNMTYTINGESNVNEDGSINYNYYKEF